MNNDNMKDPLPQPTHVQILYMTIVRAFLSCRQACPSFHALLPPQASLAAHLMTGMCHRGPRQYGFPFRSGLVKSDRPDAGARSLRGSETRRSRAPRARRSQRRRTLSSTPTDAICQPRLCKSGSSWAIVLVNACLACSPKPPLL